MVCGLSRLQRGGDDANYPAGKMESLGGRNEQPSQFLVQEQLCFSRGRAPAQEEQNYIRVVTGNQ